MSFGLCKMCQSLSLLGHSLSSPSALDFHIGIIECWAELSSGAAHVLLRAAAANQHAYSDVSNDVRLDSLLMVKLKKSYLSNR